MVATDQCNLKRNGIMSVETQTGRVLSRRQGKLRTLMME